MTRPGRLEHHIELLLPNEKQRQDIITNFLFDQFNNNNNNNMTIDEFKEMSIIIIISDNNNIIKISDFITSLTIVTSGRLLLLLSLLLLLLVWLWLLLSIIIIIIIIRSFSNLESVLKEASFASLRQLINNNNNNNNNNNHKIENLQKLTIICQYLSSSLNLLFFKSF